ncbi:unnamed protein product, partial [Ostreobium quekettii]
MDVSTQTAPLIPGAAPPPEPGGPPQDDPPPTPAPGGGQQADGQASGGANRNAPAANQPEEMSVVVMPTRVRVDSSVVCAHCTISWLSNCVLGATILSK